MSGSRRVTEPARARREKASSRTSLRGGSILSAQERANLEAESSIRPGASAGGRPRICHVCAGHSADDGRVFHRACAALAAAGYEVHLLARADGDSPYVRQGVTIHPLPRWRSRADRLRNRWRIARQAADLDPDLFHVHEPELLGPVLARAGSRPVIWDAHESYLDILLDRAWIPRWTRPAARLAWDIRERSLVRRCAAVIAATDRVACRYRPLHERVVTVANYPDLRDLEDLPAAPRDAATCVYAGTIVPNRGLPQVFAALALLRQRGLDVRLSLAGSGEAQYLRELLAQLESSGIGDLVSYHGVLPRREALALQGRSGVGLIPGLPVGNNLAAVPVKMVECMALGLPVVFSDFPSHREVAGEHSAGIPVDPTSAQQIADAIERLVRNPGLARRMGENGRRAVREHFHWGLEREKLLGLYRTVLAAPPPPG